LVELLVEVVAVVVVAGVAAGMVPTGLVVHGATPGMGGA
jgi:hypothetical protein